MRKIIDATATRVACDTRPSTGWLSDAMYIKRGKRGQLTRRQRSTDQYESSGVARGSRICDTLTNPCSKREFSVFLLSLSFYFMVFLGYHMEFLLKLCAVVVEFVEIV